MANTSSRPAAEGAAQAADGAAQAAEGAARAAAAARREERETLMDRPVIRRPIVYKRRRSGGKKKKYSRGMKDPQKLERGVTGAVERLARAATDGLSEYRKERNRSARKKKDGAIRDAVRNASRGMREGLTTAAKAPTDFSRHVTTKRLTRLVIPPMPRSPFGGWGWSR